MFSLHVYMSSLLQIFREDLISRSKTISCADERQQFEESRPKLFAQPADIEFVPSLGDTVDTLQAEFVENSRELKHELDKASKTKGKLEKEIVKDRKLVARQGDQGGSIAQAIEVRLLELHKIEARVG